jgi:AcrR family transcriptional regulator
MKSRTATTSTPQYSQGARAAAAEATGRAIVEAFLTRLKREWFDEITLDRVAADAGVTVQTVVRRFGGKVGLLGEAVQALGKQIHAVRALHVGDVDRTVANLLKDYEETGDGVIRLLALEERHESLKQFLDKGRAWHRQWVAKSLGPLLGGAKEERKGRGRSLPEGALDALVAATDVYTWKLLRRDMGRSVEAAAMTMKQLIRATIAERSTLNKEPRS